MCMLYVERIVTGYGKITVEVLRMNNFEGYCDYMVFINAKESAENSIYSFSNVVNYAIRFQHVCMSSSNT